MSHGVSGVTENTLLKPEFYVLYALQGQFSDPLWTSGCECTYHGLLSKLSE